MATVYRIAILLSEILLFEIFTSGEIYKSGFSNHGAVIRGDPDPGLKPGVIQI